MRYWPEPSVTALRTFSMSAGLAASTVTPGSTAPELSLTIPVIDACACANAGAIANMNTTRRTHWTPRIHPPGRWATAMAEIRFGMRCGTTTLRMRAILRRALCNVNQSKIIVPPLDDRDDLARRWARFVNASADLLGAAFPRELPGRSVLAIAFAGDDAVMMVSDERPRRRAPLVRSRSDYRLVFRLFE